jgi:predicted Zn-dependent protease
MYDHEYARSLEVLSPLMVEFPRNPIFQLLQGDILAKLGRKDPAAESFREAGEFSSGDTLCDRHLRALAEELTTTLAGANSDQ